MEFHDIDMSIKSHLCDAITLFLILKRLDKIRFDANQRTRHIAAHSRSINGFQFCFRTGINRLNKTIFNKKYFQSRIFSTSSSSINNKNLNQLFYYN